MRLGHLSQPPWNCPEQFVAQNLSEWCLLAQWHHYDPGTIVVVGPRHLFGDLDIAVREIYCSLWKT